MAALLIEFAASEQLGMSSLEGSCNLNIRAARPESQNARVVQHLDDRNSGIGYQ